MDATKPIRLNAKCQIVKVCFINNSHFGIRIPQGLKPAFFLTLSGTAEAMPYPKPINETRSSC